MLLLPPDDPTAPNQFLHQSHFIRDWKERWGHEGLIVESFVDGSRYRSSFHSALSNAAQPFTPLSGEMALVEDAGPQ